MNRNIILIILYMFRSNPKIRSLLVNHLICVTIFFTIYLYLFHSDNKHFKNANNFQDILYFTTSTHSTTGYGDITANSPYSKSVVIVHHVVITLLMIDLFYMFFDK